MNIYEAIGGKSMNEITAHNRVEKLAWKLRIEMRLSSDHISLGYLDGRDEDGPMFFSYDDFTSFSDAYNFLCGFEQGYEKARRKTPEEIKDHCEMIEQLGKV